LIFNTLISLRRTETFATSLLKPQNIQRREDNL
jgi:hypothetical protein